MGFCARPNILLAQAELGVGGAGCFSMGMQFASVSCALEPLHKDSMQSSPLRHGRSLRGCSAAAAGPCSQPCLPERTGRGRCGGQSREGEEEGGWLQRGRQPLRLVRRSLRHARAPRAASPPHGLFGRVDRSERMGCAIALLRLQFWGLKPCSGSRKSQWCGQLLGVKHPAATKDGRRAQQQRGPCIFTSHHTGQSPFF